MLTRRTVPSAFVLFVASGALAAGSALAAEPTEQPETATPAWQVTIGGGLTLLVPPGAAPDPRPPGIGLNLMVERGWLGAFASVDLMTAGCSGGGEADETCGDFVLWSLGPEAALLPPRSWTPYASFLFQIAHGEIAAFGRPYDYSEIWVPTAGPRLGIRYRGTTVGFYLETGPSLMRSTCQFSCSTWWFWQTSTGISFSLL
jgi:hypothetical protein